MEKGMCWGAIGVAVVMFLVFLLDLIMGYPFSGSAPQTEDSPFMLPDIFGMLAAVVVGYLGINALRDLR